MSGADVPYRLRPNKVVDREAFAELLAYIDRYTPIRDHLYVGFGGPSLEDFRLIHSRFGNTGLISIESDEVAYKRQLFNRPFSCIRCLNIRSDPFIANFEPLVAREGLDANANVIVWLDYTSPKEIRGQIEEYSSLLAKLKYNDVCKVTLNANPATLFDNIPGQPEATRVARLNELRKRLGDLLPTDVSEADMRREGYPSVLGRTLEKAAFEVMKARSGSVFQVLTAFRYADSDHQMLTVSAILLPAVERDRFFSTTRLGAWPLLAQSWGDVKEIAVPSLTDRERHAIEQDLPGSDSATLIQNRQLVLDAREDAAVALVDQYRLFYRFYPLFQRVLP